MQKMCMTENLTLNLITIQSFDILKNWTKDEKLSSSNFHQSLKCKHFFFQYIYTLRIKNYFKREVHRLFTNIETED